MNEVQGAVAPDARRRLAQLILAACLAAALIVFVLVLIASVHKTPGIGGMLSGIFVGLFSALFIGGSGAWIAMSLIRATPLTEVEDRTVDELMGELKPVLADLEAARLEVVRQVNLRARTYVPIGAAAGLALWCVEQMSGRSKQDGVASVLWNALCLVVVGAIGGYHFASRKGSAAYANLYRSRVLPLLAAHLGDLSFRSPAQLDLRALNSDKLFDEYDTAVSNNEFFGTYRQLHVSIATLLLTWGSGKQRRVSFEGLLVEVTLPRRLQGTTTVAPGACTWLHRSSKTDNCEHVALEDPRFAAAYEVWSSDQIAARALLTPAFMERLLGLGGPDAGIDGRPLVVARDSRLTLAIPRYGRDHFHAPGLRQAAAGRANVLALYHHLANVLAVADAVIGLDQSASSLAGESAVRRSTSA